MARNFPFHACLINPSWRDDGLANILIARQQPDSDIAFGLFMVDIFCLGLKDTFCNADFSIRKYKTEVTGVVYSEEEPVECPIPLAHHIIYGGIAYAKKLGVRPNKDFKLSRYILDDIANVEPCQGVEFGKDGKPFYISGPNDNVERITRQLESKVGGENFEYLLEEKP